MMKHRLIRQGLFAWITIGVLLSRLSPAGPEELYFKGKYKSKDWYRAGGERSGYPVEQNVPPWESRYKLRQTDKRKLTAADVVGPHGIVFPNWKHVGVDGGIPQVRVAVKLDERGARPGTDISDLLQSAVEQVGEKGGGAILIGQGVFHLDKPVTVKHSKVVIRGSGRDATRLVFRYSIANPNAKLPKGWPPAAVFSFLGGIEELERPLAADGKRGDTTLELEAIGDLRVGDRVLLRAPCTERWQAYLRTSHKGAWGTRTDQYEVRSIRGNTISIGQGLRIDFPVEDGSHLRRLTAVDGCGLESMTIEHACRMKFDTLTSRWAWNCWARDLKVIDAGCSGVHFRAAKRCEVRDSEFIGFDPKIHKPHQNWWGYAGFTQSTDCLMDDTIWRRFRHGPQVQFGAHGNVIRNSVFEGSDAQWHAGWSTENLFENCVVTHGPYGSYGSGCYSTGSNDGTHGPNGPRNVVYNCSFVCDEDGVFNRGVNENWIFLFNHFVVKNGSGYRAEGGSFDAIIRGNTFVLESKQWPMLMLTTRDCTGTELIDNKLYGGNGTIYEGEPPLAVNKGNKALPLTSNQPPRPKPKIASLYEYLIAPAAKVGNGGATIELPAWSMVTLTTMPVKK